MTADRVTADRVTAGRLTRGRVTAGEGDCTVGGMTEGQNAEDGTQVDCSCRYRVIAGRMTACMKTADRANSNRMTAMSANSDLETVCKTTTSGPTAGRRMRQWIAGRVTASRVIAGRGDCRQW